MKLFDTLFTERAFIYADNVPKVVKEMRVTRYHREGAAQDVQDAWWMLMLRAQAWEMGVGKVVDPRMKVPSSYYGGPTRVYIQR